MNLSSYNRATSSSSSSSAAAAAERPCKLTRTSKKDDARKDKKRKHRSSERKSERKSDRKTHRRKTDAHERGRQPVTEAGDGVHFAVDTAADACNLAFGRLYRPNVPRHLPPLHVSDAARLDAARARSDDARESPRRYFARGARPPRARVHTAMVRATLAARGALPRSGGEFMSLAPPPLVAGGGSKWEEWAVGAARALNAAARADGAGSSEWLALLRFDRATAAARVGRRGIQAVSERRLEIARAACERVFGSRAQAAAPAAVRCSALGAELASQMLSLSAPICTPEALLRAWDEALLGASHELLRVAQQRAAPDGAPRAADPFGRVCDLWLSCVRLRQAGELFAQHTTDAARAVQRYALRTLALAAHAAEADAPARVRRAARAALARIALVGAELEAAAGFGERAVGCLQAFAEVQCYLVAQPRPPPRPPSCAQALTAGAAAQPPQPPPQPLAPWQPPPPQPQPRQSASAKPTFGSDSMLMRIYGLQHGMEHGQQPPPPPPQPLPPPRPPPPLQRPHARAADAHRAADASDESLCSFWEAEGARIGDDAHGGAEGGGWRAWQAARAPPPSAARAVQVPAPLDSAGCGHGGTAEGSDVDGKLARELRAWARYEQHLEIVLWAPLRAVDEPGAHDDDARQRCAADDGERVPQWADVSGCALVLPPPGSWPAAAIPRQAVLALVAGALGAASAWTVGAWPHTARPRMRAGHARATDAAIGATTVAQLQLPCGGLAPVDCAVAIAGLRAHATAAAAARVAVCAAAQFGLRACRRWLGRDRSIAAVLGSDSTTAAALDRPDDDVADDEDDDEAAVAVVAMHCAALDGGPAALRAEGRRLLEARPECLALLSGYAAVQRAHADAGARGLNWRATLARAAELLRAAADGGATVDRLELAADCALALIEGGAGGADDRHAAAVRLLVDALVPARADAAPTAVEAKRVDAALARVMHEAAAELAAAGAADEDAAALAVEAAAAAADARALGAAAAAEAPAAAAEARRSAAAAAACAADAAASSEDLCDPKLARLAAGACECLALLRCALARGEPRAVSGAYEPLLAVVARRGAAAERACAHRLRVLRALGAPPALVSAALDGALAASPSCAPFLAAAADACADAGLLRGALGRASLLEHAAARPRCPVGWLYAATAAACGVRKASAFEAALAPDAAAGCAALWREYAAAAADEDAAARVRLRSLQQCPGARCLWLDAVGHAKPDGARAAAELARLACAHGLRVRVEPPSAETVEEEPAEADSLDELLARARAAVATGNMKETDGAHSSDGLDQPSPESYASTSDESDDDVRDRVI
jgi:hypothetical protein